MPKARIDEPEWARLPREPDMSWAQFVYFRDWAYPDGPLGQYRPRDINKIALELAIQPETARAQARNYQWHARSAAYDSEIEGQKHDRKLTSIQRMRVQGERAIQDLHQILALERGKLLRRAEDPEVPALTARELCQMQDLVLKHAKLLNVIAPEDTDGDGEAKDGGIDLSTWAEGDLDNLDQAVRRNNAKQTH